MKEACGVFGVRAPGRAASHLTFDGLYALQHRGQESAGMAVADGEMVTVVKDMGLVTRVFDERTLSGLSGHLAIGHTRYSTHGSSDWMAAQPVYRATGAAGFALGHNGNLTNTAALADKAGMLPGMVATDSDVVAELLAQAGGQAQTGAGGTAPAHPAAGGASEALAEALRAVLPMLEGAYSFVLMDAQRLYGVRDPRGLRPLCLGHLAPAGDGEPEGWVLASESPALDVIGATYVRELAPGELVIVDADGVHSEQVFPAGEVEPHLCIFEFVYFARPDSRLLDREVHGTRRRMGELLAKQSPVEADLVMGVPDSGVPAAEGYARQSGIPYGQGLVKNRYIGRTFIEPDSQARHDAVRRKLNPLRENIAGKRLVVVDDSIVRGTNSRAIVRMLRDAGATAVHLRISSPPFRWPCFYGIDTPTRTQLLAATRSLEEIERFLDVDSLAYISLENLEAAIEASGAPFCEACLTGRYPTPVPIELRSAASPGRTGDPEPGDPEPGGPGATGPGGGGGDPSPETITVQAALPGV